MNEKFVQLEIWDLLEEAKQEPLEVNWHILWDSLDVSIADLEASEQLQVGAEALLQMVEVFHHRSLEAFEELEIYTSNDGASMSNEDFAPFVRQIVDIDFDEFIEPLVTSVRKPYTFAEDDDSQSFVEVVDKEVLLDTLQYSEETIQDTYIDVTHSENVSDWINAIAYQFQVTGFTEITWSKLSRQLDIAPVEVWMGLLLGDFALSRKQDELNLFYDSEVFIEIYNRPV